MTIAKTFILLLLIADVGFGPGEPLTVQIATPIGPIIRFTLSPVALIAACLLVPYICAIIGAALARTSGPTLVMADEMERDTEWGFLRLKVFKVGFKSAEVKLRVVDVRDGAGNEQPNRSHIPLDLEWTHFDNTACIKLGDLPAWISIAQLHAEDGKLYLRGATYKKYSIARDEPAYIQLAATSQDDDRIYLLKWYRIEQDSSTSVMFKGEAVEPPWLERKPGIMRRLKKFFEKP